MIRENATGTVEAVQPRDQVPFLNARACGQAGKLASIMLRKHVGGAAAWPACVCLWPAASEPSSSPVRPVP